MASEREHYSLATETVTCLAACGSDGVRCAYLASKEKVLLCDSHSVGLRKDLNGVLLLDTALQTPISKSEDVVRVELPLPEVGGATAVFEWCFFFGKQEVISTYFTHDNSIFSQCLCNQ